jgi:MFS family permease
VNLWGYSELEAALAVSPVPAMALLTSPLVGRFSERLQPRAFGVPALVVMAAGLLALSGIPAEPSLWSVIWPLALVGLGVGATFPAVSIGSMGSISGQELGLGSGIVNMSRQVGFAIGVALLVAVFTGTIDDRVVDARRQVAVLTRDSGLGGASPGRLDRVAFANPSEPAAERPEPRTPVERQAKEIVDQEVRDSYADAFRVAALVTLLAIPFSLTMRRRPGEAAVPQPEAAAAG